jgi:Fe2+ transport system protein FeoA
MTLNELSVGQKAKITKVGGRGSLRIHLLDMGLITGTDVEMRRKAPLGDPIEVRLRGYELTLRNDDARKIEVEVQE